MELRVLLLGIVGGACWWWGALALSVALCLGYGESSRFLKKLSTILALGLCLLPFGVAWWQGLVVSGWFGINYWLSLSFNRHTHSVTETTTGCLQGALIGSVV